jgi:hypothetical protein
MNISNMTAAAISLGLFISFAPAAVGQHPRVEVIELPQDLKLVGAEFSSDGSTIAITGEWSFAWDIFIHRDSQWKLVSRSINEVAPGPIVFGLSDDGSSLVISDWSYTSIYQYGSTIFMPKSWNERGGVYGYGSTFYSGAISGDGSSVGYSPRPGDSDKNKPALVWRGERDAEVVLADPEEDGVDYEIVSLSFDGSVAAINAFYQGPHNNIRNLGTARDAWVIDQGEITMIPPVDTDYETLMSATEISGNGQAVIGSAYGVWRDGFGEDIPFSTESRRDINYGPSLAWFWSRETGTVEIQNPDRFDSISVWDITDDASAVLGSGSSGDGEAFDQFLWYSADNQFLMIEDLFSSLGIVIDADSYYFSQISGDGSKLMGVLNRDGQSSVLIVTIPVR